MGSDRRREEVNWVERMETAEVRRRLCSGGWAEWRERRKARMALDSLSLLLLELESWVLVVAEGK
jgi:uncharacterized protein YjiS (DUF1127 family)